MAVAQEEAILEVGLLEEEQAEVVTAQTVKEEAVVLDVV